MNDRRTENARRGGALNRKERRKTEESGGKDIVVAAMDLKGLLKAKE